MQEGPDATKTGFMETERSYWLRIIKEVTAVKFGDSSHADGFFLGFGETGNVGLATTIVNI